MLRARLSLTLLCLALLALLVCAEVLAMSLPVGFLSPAASARGGLSTLTQGLVAYWKLDEASGIRADATGRGNDLNPTGTVGQTTGRIGSAATFGTGNYLSRPATADLMLGDTDWTFAGWIYSTRTGGPTQNYFLSRHPSGGAVVNYEGLVATNATDQGSLQLQFWNGSYKTAFSPTGTFTINTWQHAHMWHNAAANVVGVQVNAGTIYTTPTAGMVPPSAGSEPLFLGRRAPGAAYLGYLDAWGIWTRLLTASEVAQLAAGASPY